MKTNNIEDDNCVTNDAVRAMQRQRTEHRTRAAALAADLKQLARRHQETLDRLEKECEEKRGELFRARQTEDWAARKLDKAIAAEQNAEAERQREEAELTAHVERLKPALARLGVAVGGGQ